MALIKCPECGKEVSTSADVCPHCGFPIKKSLSENNKNCPEPLNSSWMDYWKGSPSRGKWGLTITYFVNLLIILFFVLLGYGTNDEFPSWAIAGIVIFGFVSIFTFSFWIAGFICLKYKTACTDGYNVIVVAGIWNNILIIENKVFERAHNRHLDGVLPNGVHVKADIAFWDSSIRITIGN